jgi:hypothetical protein
MLTLNTPSFLNQDRNSDFVWTQEAMRSLHETGTGKKPAQVFIDLPSMV